MSQPLDIERLVSEWRRTRDHKREKGRKYEDGEANAYDECADELEEEALRAAASSSPPATELNTGVVVSVHRCRICGTRWLCWPDSIHGGGWNLLDKYSKPGSCCDNAPMGNQIEHLRDLPLGHSDRAFQRICDVAAENLARAERAEAAASPGAPEGQLAKQIIDLLKTRSEQWRCRALEAATSAKIETKTLIAGTHRAAADLYEGIANGIDCDIEQIEMWARSAAPGAPPTPETQE